MRSVDVRTIGRRIVHTRRPRVPELATTFHVVLVLALVETLIRWVSLPRLSRLLGVRLDLEPARADAQQVRPDGLPPLARRQLRCTRRIADMWPFSKGPCLRRSLVAGHLLRDHDPAIRLGLIGSGDEVSAHAWLEIEGRPLESIDAYQPFQWTSPASIAGRR
jgi:hypothetical protein